MRQQHRTTGQPDEDDSFSLPVENEILKLKLKAEFGAECATGSQDLPASVVNEFLKSVYEFEQKFNQPVKTISIYEKIGRPAYRQEGELSDAEISDALKWLDGLLSASGVCLDVLGNYDNRLIYTFITEEFFNHEMDDLDLPRCITHFCYEEFHPNHEMDIRERADEFLSQYLNRKLSEYSWQLAEAFILPDTRIFSRETVLNKIGRILERYPIFSNGRYEIREIGFDWNEQRISGTGHAAGHVRYHATTQDGEVINFDGPFTLLLSNTGTWWSIFYVDFPGFDWNA